MKYAFVIFFSKIVDESIFSEELNMPIYILEMNKNIT